MYRYVLQVKIKFCLTSFNLYNGGQKNLGLCEKALPSNIIVT